MRITEVDQAVTQPQLDALEKVLDRVFAQLGIDVEFTRHFLDRINDERNIRQITLSELGQLFKKEFMKWGKPIARLGPDAEAVMKDLSSDINIPFALNWNKGSGMLELVAKTIMRKKNFRTPNQEFPVESVIEEAGEKNTHLEHLEDEIINAGHDGAQRTITYLKSLESMLQGHGGKGTNVTVKWDGAPAIICGIDPEDGQFFVGTKGVFAKSPKLIKSVQDVEKFFPDQEKEGDRASLRNKLKITYTSLSKLGIEGVMQGDLLFTPDSLKTVEIAGDPYVVFKPNTITYAVPLGSELASRIQRSAMGIIFHTRYSGGDALSDMSASFDVNVEQFKNIPGIFIDDAYYKDLTGIVTLTPQEDAALRKAIVDAEGYLNALDDRTFGILSNSPIQKIGVELKAHINSYVRGGSFEQDPQKFVADFVKRVNERAEKKMAGLKTGPEGAAGQRLTQATDQAVQWVNDNTDQLIAMYGLYMRIIAAKLLIVKKLRGIGSIESFLQQGDGSYKVTSPEGFVAIDHLGNAVKLVDRLEFSAANFGDKDFG
jgi:hypothetical protein